MQTISKITLAFVLMDQGVAGHVMASDGQDHLTPLPDEVKQHLLGKVSPKDLGTVAQVNKDLNNHANDEGLWKQKAMEAGLTTKPDGVTWKKFFIQNSQLTPAIKKLKEAMDEARKGLPRKSAYLLVDGVSFDELNMLITQKKSPEEIYAYVKNSYEAHQKVSGGNALSMPSFKAGRLNLRQSLGVIGETFPNLTSLQGVALFEEGALAAYEAHVPILATKEGKLIPIPGGEPTIAVLKTHHAVREAIQNVLTKGALVEKSNPETK